MSYRYSKSTRCMYVEGLHKNIPADAVPVTPEQYATLVAGVNQGIAIVPDEQGRPKLETPLAT